MIGIFRMRSLSELRDLGLSLGTPVNNWLSQSVWRKALEPRFVRGNGEKGART